MIVHNCTDVVTSALQQQGLARTHIRIGDCVVGPGSTAVLPDTPAVEAEVSRWVARGALGRGEHPKGLAEVAAPKAPVLEQPSEAPAPQDTLPEVAAESPAPRRARQERS